MIPEDYKKEFFEFAMKLITIGFAGFATSMYNVIAGNLFLTLSILYLIWRWKRDYSKHKKEENGK